VDGDPKTASRRRAGITSDPSTGSRRRVWGREGRALGLLAWGGGGREQLEARSCARWGRPSTGPRQVLGWTLNTSRPRPHR